MSLPNRFLQFQNFELAFERVVRGSNKEYKHYYRHLFPSFELARAANLQDLLNDIKRGRYRPQKPTVIFQPKRSGILRPITLLSVRDLIIYQAIANVVAEDFQAVQSKHQFKQSFGSILAGKKSPFFYRSWKYCYRKYDEALVKAFTSGNHWIADFDLVAFYELIDHHLLRGILGKKVSNPELIELLLNCLDAWTIESSGSHPKHGIPQGPEPSAFLAECVLFHFDSQAYPDAVYLRYVDDIKLLAQGEIPLRRALLKLDLLAKERGLVPQAQKIEVRFVRNVDEIRKIIPSPLLTSLVSQESSQKTQGELLKMFKACLKKQRKEWVIDDVTRLKFVLSNLKPRKDVLKRLESLLVKRPDCAWHLASYLRKFPQDHAVATMLFNALKKDPTYDSAASSYIEAMDVCEPLSKNGTFRSVIRSAHKRSLEQSILLPVAVATFQGRRSGPKHALAMLKAQTHPLVKSILVHRLFGDAPDAPYKIVDCQSFLIQEAANADEDLARYCASLLVPLGWLPTTGKVNVSVDVLLKGLCLRQRSPRKSGTVLQEFFSQRMKIAIRMPWAKAIGRRYIHDAEQKCLRFQQFLSGDPTAKIMMLDTFNEALLQCFSQQHAALMSSYASAAGSNPNPDYGNWLRHPDLRRVLPKGATWFLNVHEVRVKADLAHAKQKSGSAKGRPTRPIAHKRAEKLVCEAQTSWAELLLVWSKIL